MAYIYETVQVPTKFINRKRMRENEAADYLKKTINEMAADGWEFQSVEMLGMEEKPGIFASFFGAKYRFDRFYVLVFRKPVSAAELVPTV